MGAGRTNRSSASAELPLDGPGNQIARLTSSRRASTYAIVLEDGTLADPAVFPTWRVGDTFLAGENLTRLRILALATEDDEGAAFDGYWLVDRAVVCVLLGPLEHCLGWQAGQAAGSVF